MKSWSMLALYYNFICKLKVQLHSLSPAPRKFGPIREFLDTSRSTIVLFYTYRFTDQNIYYYFASSWQRFWTISISSYTSKLSYLNFFLNNYRIVRWYFSNRSTGKSFVRFRARLSPTERGWWTPQIQKWKSNQDAP